MLYLVSEFDFVDECGREVLGYHSVETVLLCNVEELSVSVVLSSALRDGNFKGRWHWLLCTKLAGLGLPMCSSSMEVLYEAVPSSCLLAQLSLRAQ